MARIRSIKPEFWQDERMASVSRDARLLFIGLLNLADDFGILRGSPRLIKGMIFPFDDLSVPDLLGELERIGRIIRYRANEEDLILVRYFTRHQRIDKREKLKLALPPGFEVVEVPSLDAKGQPCTSRQVVESPRLESSANFPWNPPEKSGLRQFPEDSHVGKEGKGAGRGAGKGGDAPAAPEAPGPRAEDLQALWNDSAHPDLPRWKELNDTRRKAAKARLAERPLAGASSWTEVIARISASTFCRGENDRGWVADCEFLLGPSSAAKVLEGKYDARRGKGPPIGAAGRRVGAEQVDWTGQDNEVSNGF